METNKLIKGIVWGVSTIIGLAVAEGIYRSSVNAIDRKALLIGDGEIISDDVEEMNVKVDNIELPFDERE